MSNNQKVLLMLVVGAVLLGLYFASSDTTGTDTSVPTTDSEAMEGMPNAEDSEDDLAGIHIMGDGSVMLGNGETVTGATVSAEGMIIMPDGRLVDPVMDMRQ